jgi:hypothetical protein
LFHTVRQNTYEFDRIAQILKIWTFRQLKLKKVCMGSKIEKI